MWTVNIPLICCFTYFTGVDILVLYVIGQMTDILKLVIAYSLVRKEKWVVNLTPVSYTHLECQSRPLLRLRHE